MSSSSSSFGVGGNIGGSLAPLQREIEATAWTQVNRQAIGIVRDAIELVFTQTSPRYAGSITGYFGYRATAENPVLDHKLETARSMESMTAFGDDSWKQSYDALVSTLPPEIQEQLNAQLKLPLDQRSYEMTALNNVLILSAQFVTSLDQLGLVNDPSSVVAKRTAENILLPFVALQGSITNMLECQLEVRGCLEDLGRNFPHFDGCIALLNELAFPLEVLENVSRRIDSNFNGQLPDAAKQEAALAAEIFGKLGTQLDQINLGGNLGILRDQLHALESVALSLSLPSTTMAPLFLALALATLGLDTEKSALGDIGPHLAMINDIPNYLISQTMPNAPRSFGVLMTNLTEVTLALAIGLSSLAVSNGFGLYPSRDPTETATAKFFACELLLHLGVATGFLETYYNSLITASGGTEPAASKLTTALSQLTLGVILLAAVRYGHQPIEALLSEFPTLKGGASLAQTLFSNDPIDSEAKAALQIAADEVLTALENHEPEKVEEIFDTLLTRLGSSWNDLNSNIDTVRTATNVAATQMGAAGDEHKTEIVTVA